MDKNTVFAALHRGTQLASAATPTSADRLGWIAVYPLDLEKQSTREFLRGRGLEIFPESGRAYRIRSFEVKRWLIDADVYIGETELENEETTIVFTDDALVAVLAKNGVPVERLALPFRSNYPI